MASVPRTPQVRIYIATNAQRDYPDGAGYITLQTGRAIAKESFGMVGDDEGESISSLNHHFCELTALYWIWKNDSSHIVGLTHHRRYFAPKRHGVRFGEAEIAAANDFEELHQGADIVVAQPMQWMTNEVPEPLTRQYARIHVGHDLFMAREEVKERTPDYIDAFDFAMNLHTISHHNMFVARKVAIDEYCQWVFPILFALEKVVPYEFYDPYQERAVGYLAERLFNVWLAKNRRRYRIVYREIVRTEVGIF